MSDNGAGDKYNVTFEIELSGASATEGFRRACGLLLIQLEKLRALRTAELLADADLPVVNVEGAPDRPDLPGWRCRYTIEKT